MVGGLLFSFLFSTFDMGMDGLVNQIIGGTIGAVVLLFIVRLIKKT
ncbi:GlsB/YeaQ/YmgE family stress response membrane protein [bacterium]|nr:GlsB/YeaQ/YmgE family stress response membrane protein [bacterium]